LEEGKERKTMRKDCRGFSEELPEPEEGDPEGVGRGVEVNKRAGGINKEGMEMQKPTAF